MPSEWTPDEMPGFLQKFAGCECCEVTQHGPRRPNSPGGYHVKMCEEHTEEENE